MKITTNRIAATALATALAFGAVACENTGEGLEQDTDENTEQLEEETDELDEEMDEEADEMDEEADEEMNEDEG